ADLSLLQRARRRIADHVDELLVFVRDLGDEIAVACAPDWMEGEDALHFAVATRIEVGEVLGQAVFKLRVAGTDAGAVIADGNQVGETRVPHAFVGDEAAEACLVAVTERRIPVEAGADAVLAGEAVALVVCVDEAVKAAAFLRHVDAQVRGAGRFARPYFGSDLRAGQIVDDEQRPLEPRLGNDLSLPEMRAENSGEQALSQVRTRAPVELDLPYAALDDADLDGAVADRLLWQIRLGEEVPAHAVEGAHLGGGFVQAFEVEFFADELLDLLPQHFFRIKRVAAEGEVLDSDPDLLRHRQGRPRLGCRRQNRFGGGWQAQRLPCLLEHLTRIGPLLRLGERAGQCENNQADLRGSSSGARAGGVGNPTWSVRRRRPKAACESPKALPTRFG